MRNTLIFALLFLFANTALSAEPPRGRFYGGLEFNGGDLQVDAQEEYASFGSNETLGFGIRLGYDWSTLLITELNGNLSSSVSLMRSFDQKSINESQLLMGVKIPISDQVDLIPWVGWSEWKMSGREGWLLNTSPEPSDVIRGSDLVVRVEIAFSAGDSLKFSLYQSYADYDIAIMSTTSFGMRLYF